MRKSLYASYGALIPHIKIFEPFAIKKKSGEILLLHPHQRKCYLYTRALIHAQTITPHKDTSSQHIEICLVALSSDGLVCRFFVIMKAHKSCHSQIYIYIEPNHTHTHSNSSHTQMYTYRRAHACASSVGHIEQRTNVRDIERAQAQSHTHTHKHSIACRMLM